MFSSHSTDPNHDINRPAIPPRPSSDTNNQAGVTQTTSTTTTNTTTAPPSSSSNNDYQSTTAGSRVSGTAANNSSQVDPSVQPSTGLLHSIKKAMSQSSQSSAGGNGGSSAAAGVTNGPLEASFDAALGKFHNLSEHTRKLKEHLLNYSQLVFNTLDCSNSVAVEFQACLGGEEPNLYGELADRLVDSNRGLRGNEDRKRAHVLVNKALQTLDEQLQAYSGIQAQIDSRRAKAEELAYYLQKVQGLREKRDAQLASMSEPSAADTEKLERNIAKANNMQQIYNKENDQLILHINQLWRSRVTVVGPALLDFLRAEKELTRVHNEMLDSFQAEDILPSQANREYMDNNPELIAPTTGQSLSQTLMPLPTPHYNNNNNNNNNMSTTHLTQHQQQPLTASNTGNAGYIHNYGNTQVSGSSRAAPVAGQQQQQQVGVDGGYHNVQLTGYGDGEGEMVRSEERLQVGTETVDSERVRLRKYVKTELVSVLVPIRREKVRIEREVLLPGTGARTTGTTAASSNTAITNTTNTSTAMPPTLSSRPSLVADPRTRLNERETAVAGPAAAAAATGATSGTVMDANVLVDAAGTSSSSNISDGEFEWVILHEERPVVHKEIVAVERVRLRKEVTKRTETVSEQVRKEKIEFSHTALPVDLGVQYQGNAAPTGTAQNPNAAAPAAGQAGRPYPYPLPSTSTATTV